MKENKKMIIMIVLVVSLILVLSINEYVKSKAELKYNSSDISYKNENSKLKSNNVKDALDEINARVEEKSYTPENKTDIEPEEDEQDKEENKEEIKYEIKEITGEEKEKIRKEFKDSEDIYLLKSVFYRIAYLFSRNTGFSERSSKSLENYGKILDFISKNYTENITAIDVARELGYDHRYVTALIKKGLQTTFRASLNEYRISNAQYLLTTESKSISQIAHECGYESLCSFNRNFKEITGTTPMIFRNNAKKVKKHMWL